MKDFTTREDAVFTNEFPEEMEFGPQEFEEINTERPWAFLEFETENGRARYRILGRREENFLLERVTSRLYAGVPPT